MFNKPVWERATEKENGRTFKCSRCKGICYTVPYVKEGKTFCAYKYCPNCGRKMKV